MPLQVSWSRNQISSLPPCGGPWWSVGMRLHPYVKRVTKYPWIPWTIIPNRSINFATSVESPTHLHFSIHHCSRFSPALSKLTSEEFMHLIVHGLQGDGSESTQESSWSWGYQSLLKPRWYGNLCSGSYCCVTDVRSNHEHFLWR